MIVLVAGLPGSGKSYFATQLAVRLEGTYIGSDKVRIALDALGKYAFKDKLAVYVEMVKMANGFLKKQKVVVVDATFYQFSMRNLIYKLAEERGLKICLMLIQAQEALIKERLAKPRKDSEADFEIYKQIRDQFQTITTPHLKLESTNDNIEIMLSKALAFIRNANEGKPS